MRPEDQAPPLDLCLDEIASDQFGHQFGPRIAHCLERMARNLGCDRIVDWAELMDRLKLSKRTIQRLMDEKGFPARIELSDCRSGWRNSEVERWIRSRPRFVGE